MPDPIIAVENLGKRYQLRHQGNARYQTLRDTLAAKARQFLRPTSGSSALAPSSEEFWALRDINFEIQRGDVVGIIGRNGAGKSTLLKILSRITEPSTGRIRLRGRVASLLEVGTGFHAELSGRENIFLNGAILGMTKAEIRSKFDEIVAFAEVEKFLDTPVKHYSSGMYVRLAFAVAAHLEPEILIVDEVLAVGDAQFQNKCLGKISEVASHGRTVLFVTHQIEMVDRLTRRVIWLADGRLREQGETKPVVSNYLAALSTASADVADYRVQHQHAGPRILRARTHAVLGEPKTVFRQGDVIVITLEGEAPRTTPLDVGIVVENHRDQALFASHVTDTQDAQIFTGRFSASVTIAPPVLRKGRYKISVALFSPDKKAFYDVLLHMPAFEVAGTATQEFPDDDRWGDLFLSLKWTTSAPTSLPC